MFRNWFILSIRHLVRNRGHALVNVLGLSLGLAACLVIALSIIHDLRYDRFLPDSETIVRLYNTFEDDDGVIQEKFAPVSGKLGVMLPEVMPEVLATTRMQAWGPRQIQPSDVPIEIASGVSVETMYADSSFLTVFGYSLVEGDPRTAMDSPYKVLITESTARALFHGEPALGQPVKAAEIDDAVVGGVLKDIPSTSHMQFGMVIPVYLNPENEFYLESWENNWVLVYAKLVPGVDFEALGNKILEYYGENTGVHPAQRLKVMPLHDLHLHSSDQGYNWINAKGRDVESLLILAALGFAILLIAVINYVNLTTAQAADRAREVGIRKSLGGSRRSLVPGFLMESVVLTLLSGLLALLIVQLALPSLEPILGRDLGHEMIATPWMPLALLGAVLVAGLLAGIYPSLVLANFQPVTVLKGDFRTSRAGILLRRVLVVGQFAISIVLVVAVLVINDQLHYVLTRDLGYDRSQVLIFEADGTDDPPAARDRLLERLNADPRVAAAGSANNLPGSNLPGLAVHPTGEVIPDSAIGMVVFDVRGKWFEALGIHVLQGRTLRLDGGADEQDAVVINQAAAERLGLDNPIGQPFSFGWGEDGFQRRTIVGVVDNFHFGTARDQTQPAFFHPGRQYSSRVFVRLLPGKIEAGKKAAEEAYSDIFNQKLIGTRFLDDQFNELYRADRAFAASVSIFSGLALVIACLGILGLTSFAVKQRRREIAVRKVLGASETSLVRLLASGFLRWVLFATVIAWPVAWWLLSRWLGGFELRVHLTPIPFLLAGALALALAVATVASQSVRASRMNPTDALRSE
ncbi:ABC transporter permease [bacterium]|nr:ABC transporter permease [bacterium]